MLFPCVSLLDYGVDEGYGDLVPPSFRKYVFHMYWVWGYDTVECKEEIRLLCVDW